MPSRKTSVAVLVITALVTVTTLLLGTFVAIDSLNVRSRELENVRASLVLDADQIAISLALPMWNFDRPQIDKIAESMMRDSTVYGLEVKSADGQILISAQKGNIHGTVPAAGTGFPASGLLVEKRDITFEDRLLATVTLYATPKFVEARLRKTLVWTVLTILALDLILVLSLYLLLRVWVFKPLQDMESFAAAVSAGRPAGQVREFRGELENLRSSINRMIGQLEGRFAQLQKEITERERAEEALRQVSDRLSLATRAGGVGVWDWDLIKNVLTWDDRMFVLYGLSRENFGGAYEAWQTGIFKDDATKAEAEVQMALRGEKDFDTEFRVLWPNGTLHNIRALASVKRDASGQALRMVGTNWDITDSKVAQESARIQQQQIIQADKMSSLGMMVSGVAHEINNPNNLIMLNGDVIETFWRHLVPVLREHAATHSDWKVANIPYNLAEGKFEALINGVSGGAKRIKRIVDNLKDFARIDSGEMGEAIAMEKVVEASVGIVENLIRKSTDNFSIVHGENVPRIRGNFQKLEQVVINLITNACQALESRSKSIRISTWYEKDGNMVVLRVDDEGKGIPKDLLDKVADPFFTTKRDIGGTGLGLSVSYGIIQEHHGDIRFDSEVDRGTSIEIRIPALAG